MKKCAIKHHDEMFKSGTGDPTWIVSLGKEGSWIVVSADYNLLKNPDNRKALKEANLTTFIFSENYAAKTGWPQVEETVRWWMKIKEKANRAKVGSVFYLRWHGKEPELRIL